MQNAKEIREEKPVDEQETKGEKRREKMENLLETIKKGNLSKVAEKYIEQRKVRKAFDKVADRVEFLQDLEQLTSELNEVKAYVRKEISMIDKGKLPVDKIEFDVVAKIKGYSVFDWAKLVRKWDKEI